MARGLAPRTVDLYVREIRRAEEFLRARGTTLKGARAPAVAAYAATRPRTSSTTKVMRGALKHYWAIAGRRNPPVWAIPSMPKPDYQCRALEEVDAERLEKAARARDDLHGLAVLIGLYMGLRRSEIAEFRWDCVDDGWARVTGKGGRTRFVFLHPVLEEELRRARRRATHPVWVFPGRYAGRHVVPATVWSWVRDVGREVGLVLDTHELRHTALATAHDATGDLRSTQGMAGHRRPETTALYTRTTRRRLRQLVLAIDYGGPVGIVED